MSYFHIALCVRSLTGMCLLLFNFIGNGLCHCIARKLLQALHHIQWFCTICEIPGRSSHLCSFFRTFSSTKLKKFIFFSDYYSHLYPDFSPKISGQCSRLLPFLLYSQQPCKVRLGWEMASGPCHGASLYIPAQK